MKQNCFVVIILYKCILWTDSEISARPETFRYKYTRHSSVLSVWMIHVYVYELGHVCAMAHVEVRGQPWVSVLSCLLWAGSLVVAYTRLAGLWACWPLLLTSRLSPGAVGFHAHATHTASHGFWGLKLRSLTHLSSHTADDFIINLDIIWMSKK